MGRPALETLGRLLGEAGATLTFRPPDEHLRECWDLAVAKVREQRARIKALEEENAEIRERAHERANEAQVMVTTTENALDEACARIEALKAAHVEVKSLASSMQGSPHPGTYFTIWTVADRALAGEEPKPDPDGGQQGLYATVSGNEDTSDDAQKPRSPRGRA